MLVLFLAPNLIMRYRWDKVDIAVLERCVFKLFADVADRTQCAVAGNNFFGRRREMK
jgi:hypothetical protein